MTGNDLRQARAALGLKQRELARLLGVSNVEIYRKEKHLRAISVCQARAIRGLLIEHHAREAGCPVDDWARL